MPNLAILLLSIAAAVIYGVLHDQVTARLCVEYFTVAHHPVPGVETPSMLAVYWGFAATWWMGVLLGIPLTFAARAGCLPKMEPRELVKPLVFLLTGMALLAASAGSAGFILCKWGYVTPGEWETLIPQEKHSGFMADIFAHSASYISGVVGGGILMIWVWCCRKGRARLSAELSS